MPNAAMWHALRRHVVAFVVSFLSLTTLMVFNYMRKRLPDLTASGASAGTIAEFGLLSVPFTAAMTLPLAVLVAVLWVFTRLGAVGALAVAWQEPRGVRRLLAPVLGMAGVVAALTLVLTTQVLPRTNERLAVISGAGATEPTDRSMTIGELRAAASKAREDAGRDALARAASFEVEVHKKLALAASCVVLALTAAAIAFLLPRGGLVLVIGATVLIFAFYYVGLIAGESLADRLIVSPFVAMWAANALLLSFALLAMWGVRSFQTSGGIASQPIGLSPISSGGPTPLSLRIAASLFALIGLFRLGAAVVLTAQSVPSTRPEWIALGVAGVAGLLMAVSAFWVWQRRRRGLVLGVLAWLLPTIVSLIAFATMSPPSIIAAIAVIILWSNRHRLR